jgi:hypothetical protein
MDVHLDHAGIRRHRETSQARIVRRRITFEPHRHAEGARHRLDDLRERDEILQQLHRRQEDVERSLARLDGERHLDHFARFARRDLARLRVPGADGAARRLALAQGVAALERVRRDVRLFVLRQHFGERREWQAITHR